MSNLLYHIVTVRHDSTKKKKNSHTDKKYCFTKKLCCLKRKKNTKRGRIIAGGLLKNEYTGVQQTVSIVQHRRLRVYTWLLPPLMVLFVSLVLIV